MTITRIGGFSDALGTLQRDTGRIIKALARSRQWARRCGNRPSGRQGGKRLVDNFTAGLTQPVTPQDVVALLDVMPNDPSKIDYGRWVRIAYACWFVVHQSGDPDAKEIVHEAFVNWSLTYPHAPPAIASGRTPRGCGSLRASRGNSPTRSSSTWPGDRFLVAEPPGHYRYGRFRFGPIFSSTSPQQADAGASLLKRVKAHFRLARRSRGLLDAQRTVYRLLLAEPRENVLPMLGKIVRFLLTENVERDPLIAFAARITGDGEAFVANVEQRIAVAKARSAKQLRSREAKAADVSDIFGVATQRGNPQPRRHRKQARSATMADDQQGRTMRANTTT